MSQNNNNNDSYNNTSGNAFDESNSAYKHLIALEDQMVLEDAALAKNQVVPIENALSDGYKLISSANSLGTGDIQIIAPDGEEVVSWIADEWEEEAESVMGAILEVIFNPKKSHELLTGTLREAQVKHRIEEGA